MILLESKIKNAWALRLDQKIEECLFAQAEIKNDLSFYSSISLDHLKTFLAQNRELKISVIVLESSLLRAQRNIEKSSQLLKFLEIAVDDMYLRQNFYYLFEKGISYFIQSLYVEALEYFQSAALKAYDEQTELSALTNCILCLENLGLSYEKTLLQVQEKITMAEGSFEGIDSQIKALNLRADFRSGLIANVLENIEVSKATQASFFQLWVSELPYIFFRKKKDELGEALLSTSPYFFNRTFRARTLLGRLHPEDSQFLKVSDAIDRIYLWTWRWLCHPEKLKISLLTSTLRQLDLSKLEQQMTEEDANLFCNSLLWLSLFDIQNRDFLFNYIKKIRRLVVGKHLVLEYEFLIISLYFALLKKDKLLIQEYQQQIKIHPANDISELRYLQERSGPLKKVDESISGLSISSKLSITKAPVIVDTKRWQVYFSSKRVSSAIMVRAIKALTMGPVTLEDFLSACFGISSYDKLYHYTKINSFLARLRKLLPQKLNIKIKEGKVIPEGDWHLVQVIDDNLPGRDLREDENWQSFVRAIKNLMVSPTVKKTKVKDKAIKSLQVDLNKSFSRIEIQERFHLSKASATRMISIWLKEGRIKRRGRGKSIKYFFQTSI